MKEIFSIFLAFVKIGAVGFGGGLAMLPLIEKEIVHNHQWISLQEFVDIIAVSEMTPGPIAVNSATFVGYKVAAIAGALAGSLGIVIVSFVLITALAKYFMKIKDKNGTKAVLGGIRPAVLGLILSAAISVGRTAFVDIKSVLIAVLVFTGLTKYKMHPILGIALAALLGTILY